MWNAELANLGTFVGAICFLLGAAMLLPAMPGPDAAVPGPTEAGVGP